jgi:hypothetical protein
VIQLFSNFIFCQYLKYFIHSEFAVYLKGSYMKTAIKQVPISNLMAAPGVSLLDCQREIQQSLNFSEFLDYIMAIKKIQRKKPLRRTDLELFNRIDKATMTKFGVCLKDSNVTRARINACKHFGIEFQDAGGLVDHMNMVEAANK